MRLGSSMVIVSRSFCNTDVVTNLDEVRMIFNEGIGEIRRLEAEAEEVANYFKKNQNEIKEAVKNVVEQIEKKENGN